MASLPVLPAAADDLTQIVALEEQCFSLPHTLDQLRYELEDDLHDLFVVKDRQEVLGYVGLSHILDEGYISNVAVAGKARRQGIADTLLAKLDSVAAEYPLSFISLEVRESNLPARRLYESCGFCTAAVRKNYYERPREDAVLMTAYFRAEE